MQYIVVDDEQAKLIAEATDTVEIRDRQGKHVGYVGHITEEDIALAKQRAASKGPCYTTQQVIDHLRSLESKYPRIVSAGGCESRPGERSMQRIIVDDEQAKLIAEATRMVKIRDRQGKHLGDVDRGVSPEQMAIYRQRIEADEPLYTTAEVLERLRSLASQ
jgi:hypothetical protein